MRNHGMNQDNGRIQLRALFDLAKKKEIEKYVNDKKMFGSDLADFIMNFEYFGIGFWHFPVFRTFEPEHLSIEIKDLDCFQPSCRGDEEKEKRERKVYNRIKQVFRDRRVLATHFFPKLDSSEWNLIYFDQRDTSKYNSHWAEGSHIHFSSSKWHRNSAQEIWEMINKIKPVFPSSVHISFTQDLTGEIS